MKITSVDQMKEIIKSQIPAKTESGGKETIAFPKTQTQAKKDFEEDIKMSKLDDCVPNKSWLAKNGFNVPFKGMKMGRIETKDQPYLQDMNGGRTYQNKNGDTIRISEFEAELATGLKGSKQVEYKTNDGKTSDTVIFDPDGNPLKGYLTVKNDDGTIVKYQYEYDENGNKTVKSKNIEYPSRYTNN